MQPIQIKRSACIGPAQMLGVRTSCPEQHYAYKDISLQAQMLEIRASHVEQHYAYKGGISSLFFNRHANNNQSKSN